MEGEKRAVSSSTSSSLTSDLFGSNSSFSASSSTGIFGSIFASSPPNLVVGREFSHLQSFENKHHSATLQLMHHSATHAWNIKPGHPDSLNQNKQSEGDRCWENDNPYYNEQNLQPFNLSSSIYYGGPDMYISPRTRESQEYLTFNKDQGDDDSSSASRGNWWQGGLYY